MFDHVAKFEEVIAEFFNAKYAVAVDSCTHAIELCLRLSQVKQTQCPKHTYLSIPMTLNKLQIQWSWVDNLWHDYYYLNNTNIIDAAVLWEKDSYIPGTMMCLSFQFKKHLSIGRGGMILLDDKEAYHELIKLSYDGRVRDIPWAEQNITSYGYHYYMTPESALLGLEKFQTIQHTPPQKWTHMNYPDLSKLPVFANVK